MRPTATRGATNNFQKPANWDDEKDGVCGDLQVRMQAHGERSLCEMVSTWKPDAADLAHLNRGGVIELCITSTGHPPVGMVIVDPVESIATPDLTLRDNDGSSFVEPGTGTVRDERTITINEEAHGHG